MAELRKAMAEYAVSVQIAADKAAELGRRLIESQAEPTDSES